MNWTAPSAADFKAFWTRDFPYAPDSDPNDLNYITDADITRAIAEGEINFNPDLFGDDAQVTIIFMHLAAFYLVVNIQNASKGVASQAKFPISSAGVGGVNVSYQIPERYSKDPYLAQFMQNGYGMKYLSMALPYTIGSIELIEGTTTPT